MPLVISFNVPCFITPFLFYLLENCHLKSPWEADFNNVRDYIYKCCIYCLGRVWQHIFTDSNVGCKVERIPTEGDFRAALLPLLFKWWNCQLSLAQDSTHHREPGLLCFDVFPWWVPFSPFQVSSTLCNAVSPIWKFYILQYGQSLMQILTYDSGLFKSKLTCIAKIAGLGLQFWLQNKFIKKNKSTKNTSEIMLT